ncbi:MAG TPA: hypothetical protein G4N93_02255 [Dehalococcoidia bacterium]|nr:hypothetical protein [Dehalococcoidia bacterium]
MSEKESLRVISVPTWGIFLLFLGVVFLLQTLNVLPWGLWGTLWRFWPVLIIIIGLGILLRHYNVWLVSLLVSAMLGACLGIAIWQYGSSPLAGTVSRSYSEPMDNMESAQIEVDFTAGSLTIGSLPFGSSNFMEATSEVRGRDGGMNVDFHRQNGNGRLYLSTERANQPFWGGDGIRWDINFTGSIPLTINIKSAASNIGLELSELRVTELRLDIDAGNCKVTMPSLTGTTYVYIKSDVANIELTIPDGVVAKIRADIDLSFFNVDQTRFPKQGDYYISDNYDTAQNRIYLEIDCDVGRVQVK